MKPAWMPPNKMNLLYRAVIFSAWFFFKIFYRHRVYGLEHYYTGGALLAANHASYYDPPILAISWPEEGHFLAREGLFKNRWFGAFIRAVNSHPVSGDASDISVFKTICKLLSEGKKVFIFPEGKRCHKDELDKLKPGIGMLIARTQTAIVPAYIHGTFGVWNRRRKFPKLWGKTACVFGTPILWKDFAHLDKRQAQEQITVKLAASINELRHWYEKGAKGTPP